MTMTTEERIQAVISVAASHKCSEFLIDRNPDAAKAVLEFWKGPRKVTVYIERIDLEEYPPPTYSWLMIWGPDIHSQMLGGSGWGDSVPSLAAVFDWMANGKLGAVPEPVPMNPVFSEAP
jgi:hypothetical protein